MSIQDEFQRLVLTMIQRVHPEATITHALGFIKRFSDFIPATEAQDFYNVFKNSSYTQDIVEQFSIDALVNFACYSSLSDGELKIDKESHYFEPIHKYAGKDLFINRTTGKPLDEKRMKDLFDIAGKGFRLHIVYKSCLEKLILGSKYIGTHETTLMYNENFYEYIDSLGSNRDIIHKAMRNHYSYVDHMPESAAAQDNYVRMLISEMKLKGEAGFRNNYKPEFSKACGHHVLKMIACNGHKLLNHLDKRAYGKIMATLVSDGADWYKGLCTDLTYIDNPRDDELSEDEKLKALLKVVTKSYYGIDLYGPTIKIMDREALKRNTPRIHLKKIAEMTEDISFMHNATKKSRRSKIIEDLGI